MEKMKQKWNKNYLIVSARKSWFLLLKNVKNLLFHYELNIFSFICQS